MPSRFERFKIAVDNCDIIIRDDVPRPVKLWFYRAFKLELDEIEYALKKGL